MAEHPPELAAQLTPESETLAALVANARPPRPKHPLPIVSIGAGGIVHDAHLPAYRKAGFPVAILVDPDLPKAQKLAAQFGVPAAVATIPEALAIASAHPGLAQTVFDVALPAKLLLSVLPQIPDGSAVLIQKPMGETLAEAAAIERLCREKRLTAAVNFQLRYAPVMLAARALTQAGMLGQVHDMEVHVNCFMPWDLWTFLSTAPRLEILYHSIHYMDLVRSWFGNPSRVLAKTLRNPVTPTLSATRSVILLEYDEWKRVYIHANHAHTWAETQRSQVLWEGSEGAMEAIMGVNLDYPVGKPDRLRFARRAPIRNGQITADEPWQTLDTTGNWFPDAFMGSMGALQAYVTGAAAELPSRVADALDTMRAVEAAYLSSRFDGQPLPEIATTPEATR